MKIIKIGRNADNDIVIKDETNTVSGYHAEVKVTGNGVITICDISRNGTRVNGILIVKNHDHILNVGDDVQFARAARLDLSKLPFPKVMSDDATHISNGVKESCTIGTSSDNKIVLNDPTSHISRHHAILKLMNNGNYFIYDQSTNGTTVNGVKIKPKTDFPVSVTDQISFAQVQQFDWSRVTKVPTPPASPKPSTPNKPIAASTTSNGDGWVWTILGVLIAVGVGWYSAASKSDKTEPAAIVVHSQSKPKVVTKVVSIPSSTAALSGTSNLSLSNLYDQKKNAVILIYTSDGTSSAQGSGFFISSSGIAVSNYHVFKGTTPGLETIKTTNGNTYKVESVLAKSEESDYIVFKVASQGSSFPFLQIAQTLPRVGENVFAIGAPEGLELTLSTGIVSAMRQNNKVIQTTTEITHGSSGGPLFNMNGQVIGITSAGMGDANLNFAVNLVGLNLNH